MKKILLMMSAAVLMAVACQKEENPVQKEAAVFSEGDETTYNEIVAQIVALKNLIDQLPDTPENEYYKQSLQEMLSELENSAKDYAYNVVGNNGGDTKSFSVRTDTLYYWSVDAFGKPLKLSGLVHVPLYKSEAYEVSGMLVNCHATQPQGMPSGGADLGNGMNTDAMMSAIYSLKQLTADGLVVVEPDYEGFGLTKDRPQTYLCQKLIAQQCADMLRPALEHVKSITDAKGNKYSFAKDFSTYIVGYSQGGGQALALTRYLTVEDPVLMKEVNLKNSVCGAGPYDPELTFQTWLDRGEIGMSVLLPMVLSGYMAGHSDKMSGIGIKSYFSDLYNSSGIPEMVYNMTGGFVEGMAWDAMHSDSPNFGLASHPVKMDIIMSDEAKNEKSPIMTVLHECLEYEQVCYDWTPVSSIILMSTENDNIVPVENTNMAYQALRAKGGSLVSLNIAAKASDHLLGQLGFTNMLTGKQKIYKKNNK